MTTATNSARVTEGAAPQGSFTPAEPVRAWPEPEFGSYNRYCAALRKLDNARTWPEREQATAEFLALGQGAVPYVLQQLTEVQPSGRTDVPHLFLATNASINDIVDAAKEPGSGEELRIALARVLSLCLEQPGANTNDVLRGGVAATLCEMAGAPEPSVRVAAIDALALSGVTTPDVRSTLEVSLSDNYGPVRHAAREALDEINS